MKILIIIALLLPSVGFGFDGFDSKDRFDLPKPEVFQDIKVDKFERLVTPEVRSHSGEGGGGGKGGVG